MRSRSPSPRYGAGYVPEPHEMDSVTTVIQDYRDLGIAVVKDQLDKRLQRHMVSVVSNYTAGVVSGWKPTF